MEEEIIETATLEDSTADVSVSDDMSEPHPVDSAEDAENLGGDSNEISTEISQTIAENSKDYEPIIADSSTAIIETVTLVGSDIQTTVYDSSSAIVNTMLFCAFLIVGMLTALKIFGGRV